MIHLKELLEGRMEGKKNLMIEISWLASFLIGFITGVICVLIIIITSKGE